MTAIRIPSATIASAALLLAAAAFVACGDTLPGDIEGVCQPRSCEQAGVSCGAIDDGCGVTLECGACSQGGAGGVSSSATGGDGASGGSSSSGAGAGGGGPVPFWEYRAANLSPAEIAAFNDPQTGAGSLGVNKTFHFDVDDDDNWFRRQGGQAPTINSLGYLVSVRQTGDTNAHSGYEAWANGEGSTTEPNSRSFPLHRRYRFGFDLFMPGSASTWMNDITWAIVLQAHQVSDGNDPPNTGRNPPFALNVESINGQGHFTVAVRGDDRQFLPDKGYQFQENVELAPITLLDTWYTFEVEVVWSYSGEAETKVWLDGSLVYNNSVHDTPGFKNCFNDVKNNVNIGPVMPYFGLYNYDLPASPMEVQYDNMWIAEMEER